MPSNNSLSDFTILTRRSLFFNQALKKGDIKSIYNLFNPTFREEIELKNFIEAFEEWLGKKKIRRIKTKFINVTPLSGVVSTWIYFTEDIQNYYYLPHFWVKIDTTWYLYWISKVLNHKDFQYANRDTVELKKVLVSMIENAISRNKIKKFLPDFTRPKYLVIFKKGRPYETEMGFPDLRIKWLSEEEIKKYAPRLKLKYYLDFGTIRIFNGLAKGYLDFIPIPSPEEAKRKKRRRSRGIEMFLKKREGEWQFISFGSRW